MKKHPLNALLYLVVGFSYTPLTRAQWVQNSRPWAGDIVCFTSIGDTIFAGTNGSGVFRSPDNGRTWDFLPFDNYSSETRVFSLAAKGTALYAG